MCTLTIGRTHRSLLVTVNRDESRTREELPPRVFAGVSPKFISWVAPLDGRSGGTWVGANDRGVAACLLNLWPDGCQPSPSPKTLCSRGKIIPELMGQGDMQDCQQWLRTRLDPHRFKPFQLVLADIEMAFCVTWQGTAAAGAGPQKRMVPIGTVPKQKWTLFCSSSYRPGRVTRWRKQLFETWQDSSSPFQGSLPSIHLHHSASKAGWGPLVNRPNAQTRSITQIEISAHPPRVQLRYWNDPWDADGSAPPHRLSLPLMKCQSACGK